MQRALFWSHLTTSCLLILLRIIQVFIGKLQTALYMCFLEQGDLASAAVLLKPLRRSVLSLVFLVPVVTAALRSFTSSPCIVLGLFCTFRMITDTARGDILHGAPDLERWTVVWCCCHLRIIAPIVVCFLPSCLPMVL